MAVTFNSVRATTFNGAGMDMGFHLADNIASIAGVKSFRHEWL